MSSVVVYMPLVLMVRVVMGGWVYLGRSRDRLWIRRFG